ncbi:ArnT family glycosyltransferase [Uliginosibacterium paludis]|uniref:Glycosyltransferase RgtA/B/C/D-like domain-containing protein n=1 Tax=Uliginosibacterium paludis TaxID=1615952 RepID=A0ABV2CRP1_9RHOO
MHTEQFTEFPSSKPAIHVPNWALILLFLAYALPANIGHAPWRGDDAEHIGVAFSMMLDGTWLTPQIAGQAFLDSPPLAYWLGALSGKLLGWLLPLHDAIRLSMVGTLGVMILCLRHAARDLYGRESASAAAMLSIGSVGLLVHAHEMQPLITLASAVAGVIYGLVQMRKRTRQAPFITGIATAACFLSGGLPGLLASLPVWLVLPLSEPSLRDARLLRQFALAFLTALALSLPWPFLLAVFDPGFLDAWWQNQLDLILPHTSHLAHGKDFANLVGWFTWPLWPLVIWSLWLRRRSLREFGHLIPLAAALFSLILATGTGGMRPANLVPLLPPLIVMASGEQCRLRRGAANAFDWFGLITFSMVGIALWLAWLAMHFGWPEPLSRNILRLLPGFQPSWAWYQLLIAVSLSAGWLIALFRLPFFQLRGAVRWAIGVTLTWGLATTLCFSWFDYNKNYQPVSTAIAGAVARQKLEGCVAGIDVGDSQRAAFLYFNNLRIAPRTAACELKLAYATGRNPLPVAPEGWETVWQMERGSGRLGERFALYRRPAD